MTELIVGWALSTFTLLIGYGVGRASLTPKELEDDDS